VHPYENNLTYYRKLYNFILATFIQISSCVYRITILNLVISFNK
jgi:hypothetical protein